MSIKKYIVETLEGVTLYVQTLGASDDGVFHSVMTCVNDMEDADKALDEAYQKGLEDAWGAARKLSLMLPEDAEKVFAGAGIYNRFNLGYSGVEAIEKLKAYEQRKVDDEIKVGDEVRNKSHDTTWTAVVIKREKDVIYLMGRSGAVADYHLRNFEKTGRHFDIAGILEEMKK